MLPYWEMDLNGCHGRVVDFVFCESQTESNEVIYQGEAALTVPAEPELNLPSSFSVKVNTGRQ